ncbi:MAG: hypothetical protein AAFX06_24980 [Planctomycetota bacterium]
MKRTFKERVELFWQWYADVGPRFYETIEAGECESLLGEVSEFMGEVMPGLAWVFGPGENGGHSFTVSGEGMVAKQLLADYWLSQSVDLSGWTFYESRQANEEINDVAIEIQGLGRVDAENFLIRTKVDSEREMLDIVAWHPLFEELAEEHHVQLLFLLLDEALGEFGTQSWVGDISIGEVSEAELDGRTVHRLTELPKFIGDVQRYHEWQKLSPLHSYTGYSIRQQQETLRGDTVAGTTCIPRLVFQLIDEGGKLAEDPLDDTGASMAYLEIDGAIFPDGEQAPVRHNIEEALEERLENDRLGRPLGGAAGTNASYIDLLLIDGERSREAVEETLKGLELEGRYRWHPFA